MPFSARHILAILFAGKDSHMVVAFQGLNDGELGGRRREREIEAIKEKKNNK